MSPPSQVVMILGGTGGLGHELVKLYARGPLNVFDRVIRVGTRVQELRQPVEVVGSKVQIGDLTWAAGDSVDVLRMGVQRLDHSTGAWWPDLVINCIGLNLIKPTMQLHSDDFMQVMRANVWSTVQAAQLLAQSPDGLPTLVSIGSSASDGAGAHSLAYVASKHALTGVTRSLTRDLGQLMSVVQINLPKLRGTEMSDYIDVSQAKSRGISVSEEQARQAFAAPAGEVMRASEAAQLIHGLLLHPDQRRHLHGSIIKLGYPS